MSDPVSANAEGMPAINRRREDHRMAKRTLTTRVSARANGLLETAVKEVHNRQTAIRILADALREELEALHGGLWWVHIDHSCGLVSIARKECFQIDATDLREAV